MTPDPEAGPSTSPLGIAQRPKRADLPTAFKEHGSISIANIDELGLSFGSFIATSFYTDRLSVRVERQLAPGMFVEPEFIGRHNVARPLPSIKHM